MVQILGGVGNPSVEKHANRLVKQLADLLRGEAHLLPVPGLVASKAIADVLAQDPHVRGAMALFDRISVALLGIGSIDPSAGLAGDENSCSVQELQVLKDRGAVGQVCLRFYDINGEEVRGDLESRVFGLELEQLKRIPAAVGIACGKRKRPAILGALRGRWINVLITDQFTAQSLVME